MYVVFYLPFLLGEPESYQTGGNPAHVVPEWYFLHVFAILRSFTFDISIFGNVILNSKEIGVIAMAGALVVPFFLPFLDRNPARSTKFRPIYRYFFWLFVVVCILLAQLGMQTDGVCRDLYPCLFSGELVDDYVAPGCDYLWVDFNGLFLRAFPVVLPLLSFFGKPKPLPHSIANPVMPEGDFHMLKRFLSLAVLVFAAQPRLCRGREG